jgi:PAS domain S-box-containing protein
LSLPSLELVKETAMQRKSYLGNWKLKIKSLRKSFCIKILLIIVICSITFILDLQEIILIKNLSRNNIPVFNYPVKKLSFSFSINKEKSFDINNKTLPSHREFFSRKYQSSLLSFIEPEQKEVTLILFFTLLIFAGISFYFFCKWKRQKSIQQLKLTQVEKEKQILIEHYSTLTENANDSIILANEEGIIIEVNKHTEEMYGYTKKELIGMNLADLRNAGTASLNERLKEIKNNNGLVFECQHKTKNGEEIAVEISAKFICTDGENYLQNIIRDLSESRKTYKELERETRLYAVLSQINQCIIQSKNQDELFYRVCNILIETGRFKFCWIGLVDEAGQEIIPQASEGEDQDYLIRVNLKLFEVDAVIRPFKKTIISDSTIVIKNIYDEKFLPWIDEAVKRDFISHVSVPIRKYGVATGCFNIYATDKNFFKEKEIKLIEEIAQNISFAIDNLEKEHGRIRNENKIRENEQRLSNLFRNLPGMTYRCKNDNKWTMEFVSDGIKELTGYKPDEIINNKTISFKDIIHAEHRQYVDETIQKSLGSHKQFSLVYKIKTKSGLLKWVLEKGTGIYNKNNELIAIEGFIGDITKQKEYQRALFEETDKRKELEIIVERSPAIAYKVLPEEGFPSKYISENISQFGYSAVEFLSGKFSYTDIIHPEDRERVLNYITESADEVVNNFNQDYRIITKSGETRWVDDRTWIARDENKKVISFEGILIDITRKKQVEKELIKAKEKAEQINLIKNNFFANMSHELRTPLIGILGNAELIRDESNDDEIKEMATVIFQSGRRLSETLNMILDIAKLEADQTDVKLETMDVIPLIKESIALFEPTATDKRLKFIYSINLPLSFAEINSSFFSSVVNNLLNNAIKYTLKGEIVLSVSNINDRIKISIRDTGIGIDENFVNQVFEPFRQVSEGFARTFEGTGLGLTITKKYVELMYGRIYVESKMGTGSEFTVTIPAVQNTKENILTIENIIETSIQSSENPKKKKILILDDDEISLRTLSTFLKNDYDIDTVYDANTALAIAKKNIYDAFLLDIGLKGSLSGLDVAQELKKLKKYSAVPIIAVTAYAMTGDREKILSGGCTHYISKPCGKRDLQNLVKTALEENDNVDNISREEIKVLESSVQN